MTDDGMRSARNRAAPLEECRITRKSIRIAWRFLTVSIRVSPFSTLEWLAATERESAERRFSASSKDARVRVEGSKKRFTTVFPRRIGTFFTSRSEISRNERLVSRISSISARDRSSSPIRSFRSRRIRPLREEDTVDPVLLCHLHGDHLALRGRHVLPDVVRLDRQLAVSPIDEDSELNRARAPEVDDLVESRAHRAACVEHVVHQDEVLLHDVEGDLGRPHDRLVRDRLEVVAVEGDVEDAQGHADLLDREDAV